MKLPGTVRAPVWGLLATLSTTACAADGYTDLVDPPEQGPLSCSIPVSQIHRGAFKDGIPALTNPTMGPFGAEGTEYLRPDDRVIGLVVGGQPIAIPLNVLWWHEIVNLDAGGTSLAVTHCPLTGSSLAFDRGVVDGAEFGVSGLLYQNNLIMYDRSGDAESLWPQMMRGARCGALDGTALPMYPIVEMTWEGWVDLHPDTRVVSDTGRSLDYTEYPYDDYADVDNERVLFPMSPIDERRPPKERALGVPDGTGGTVFPFGALREASSTDESKTVVHTSSSSRDFVVFWDGGREAAMAFRPVVDGQALTFRAEFDEIRDHQTGSEWSVDGMAIEGPLAGAALEPVAEAFVAFWFAWPAFYPDLDLWSKS